MTVHFEQGEYSIKQSNKEVGRLVALDATATEPAKEYFFLYQNIGATAAEYGTYTAPSPDDKLAGTNTFGQSTDIEWEIVPKDKVNERDFDDGTYRDDLETHLESVLALDPLSGETRSLRRVELIIAKQQVPSESKSNGQVVWGYYKLKDLKGRVIGGLDVEADGTTENWYLDSSVYEAPSPNGDTMTIQFVNTKIPPDTSLTRFCATSSRPVYTG